MSKGSPPSNPLEKARRRYLDSHPLFHADLSGLALANLPDWLFDRDLVTLDLHDNQLTDLPAEVGLLTMLEVLDMRGNPGMTAVPEAVRELSRLQELYLDGTGITDLPDWLTDLPSLRYIQRDGTSWRRAPQNE